MNDPIKNIPQELKDLAQWVAYAAVPKDNGKVDKIPKNPKTGGNAVADVRGTWGTFDQAIMAVKKYRLAGIGFEFSKDDEYSGIDLDDCLNPGTGKLSAWAIEHVDCFNSYTEITPSGQGLHIIVKGKLPPGGRKKGNIECYDSGRFFTVTGNLLTGNRDIRGCQTELEEFHRRVFQEPKQQSKPAQSQPVAASDEDLIQKAKAAANGRKFSQLWSGDWQAAGFPSQSEADQALCNHLAFWTGNDAGRLDALFRQSGLYRGKWDRADYRGATIQKAIAQTPETYSPSKQNKPMGNAPPVIEPNQTCIEQPQQEESEFCKSLFPASVMSGVAGAFADLFSSYTESPVQFYYFAFLTCLGNILSERITIESQISPQPRFYTLLLGESADDRKSTAIDQTVKFFQMALADKVNVCHGVGSAEGLQKRLEKSNRLLLCFDEFKSFISKCKIDGSVLLPCVTTLFEANKYESRTKTSEITLENVYLSLLAASTVNTYENVWISTFTDIGFNNRLFLVTGRGERRFSIPPKIPLQEINHLRYDLGSSCSLSIQKVNLR